MNPSATAAPGRWIQVTAGPQVAGVRREDGAVSLTELVNTLWRQREALELLLFKMDEEQLLLAAGRGRWLAHATREVELVVDQIRHTGILRAIHSDAVAQALGLRPNASLAALSDAAPDPWRDMLRDHRTAFLALTAEVNALAEANRDLLSSGQLSSGQLTSGQRAVREAMLAVTGAVQTYGATGAVRDRYPPQ